MGLFPNFSNLLIFILLSMSANLAWTAPILVNPFREDSAPPNHEHYNSPAFPTTVPVQLSIPNSPDLPRDTHHRTEHPHSVSPNADENQTPRNDAYFIFPRLPLEPGTLIPSPNLRPSYTTNTLRRKQNQTSKEKSSLEETTANKVHKWLSISVPEDSENASILDEPETNSAPASYSGDADTHLEVETIRHIANSKQDSGAATLRANNVEWKEPLEEAEGSRELFPPPAPPSSPVQIAGAAEPKNSQLYPHALGGSPPPAGNVSDKLGENLAPIVMDERATYVNEVSEPVVSPRARAKSDLTNIAVTLPIADYVEPTSGLTTPGHSPSFHNPHFSRFHATYSALHPWAPRPGNTQNCPERHLPDAIPNRPGSASYTPWTASKTGYSPLDTYTVINPSTGVKEVNLPHLNRWNRGWTISETGAPEHDFYANVEQTGNRGHYDARIYGKWKNRNQRQLSNQESHAAVNTPTKGGEATTIGNIGGSHDNRSRLVIGRPSSLAHPLSPINEQPELSELPPKGKENKSTTGFFSGLNAFGKAASSLFDTHVLGKKPEGTEKHKTINEISYPSLKKVYLWESLKDGEPGKVFLDTLGHWVNQGVESRWGKGKRRRGRRKSEKVWMWGSG